MNLKNGRSELILTVYLFDGSGYWNFYREESIISFIVCVLDRIGTMSTVGS